MTNYIEYGVKLTNGQKSKLASAILNQTPLTLRLKHSHLRGTVCCPVSGHFSLRLQ